MQDKRYELTIQLVTGRVWRGSAFGGARGRTDVEHQIGIWMERLIDDMITHTMHLKRLMKHLF